jgi:hypothetical protein
MAVSLERTARVKSRAMGQSLAGGAGWRWVWGCGFGLSAGWEIQREGPQREGGGEDVGVGERGLGEPDGVYGGEDRKTDGCRRAEQALGEPEDRQQTGCGEGADEQAGGHNMVAHQVPEGAEQDVRQRRVGVGELRDELAGVIEVQRGRDVIAALVPVVRQAQQGGVAEGDGGEEQHIE